MVLALALYNTVFPPKVALVFQKLQLNESVQVMHRFKKALDLHTFHVNVETNDRNLAEAKIKSRK